MKVGDLIKWTDYKDSAIHPVEYIGLVVANLTQGVPKSSLRDERWHDLYVLCEGEYVYWTSWQCEVINESW